MQKEIWKDIHDYDGYQVSSYGRVVNKKGHILKGWVTKGYHYVSLINNSGVKKYRVHRLVAEAFICNPNNLPYINHIDENKLNNNIDNLEWCTQKENLDKYYIPRRKLNCKNLKSKITNYHRPKKVLQYDLKKNFIKSWNSTMDIERELHISSGNISLCCRGIKPTAKGYIWKYADE